VFVIDAFFYGDVGRGIGDCDRLRRRVSTERIRDPCIRRYIGAGVVGAGGAHIEIGDRGRLGRAAREQRR
jgi:hypothetical protein